ncbi:MAG: hypothetical protein IRZ08_13405 [Frankia sp.]|nr:hypothetical protein [Frankia sp.]
MSGEATGRRERRPAELMAASTPPPGPGWAQRARPSAEWPVDVALRVALRRLADPPGVLFTERQLYYEVCRVLSPADRLPRRIAFTSRPLLGYPRFLAALRRHGTVPGMLPAATAAAGADLGTGSASGAAADVGGAAEPAAATRTTGAATAVTGGAVSATADAGVGAGLAPTGRGWLADEGDVLDYGLPRLLVCQDRATARMLVANDVPLEVACPVLAAADLPPDPRLVDALARFPGSAVHVLHDASAAGLAFAAGLGARLGLPASVPVVCLGLLPRHAADLRLAASRDAAPTAAADGWPALTRREERWLLAGMRAELAAVPPARLLRAVHRLAEQRPRTRQRGGGLAAARSAGFLTWPAP